MANRTNSKAVVDSSKPTHYININIGKNCHMAIGLWDESDKQPLHADLISGFETTEPSEMKDLLIALLSNESVNVSFKSSDSTQNRNVENEKALIANLFSK